MKTKGIRRGGPLSILTIKEEGGVEVRGAEAIPALHRIELGVTEVLGDLKNITRSWRIAAFSASLSLPPNQGPRHLRGALVSACPKTDSPKISLSVTTACTRGNRELVMHMRSILHSTL